MYDADQAPPSEVINACNTLPCMAQRRIVLVKGAHQYNQNDLKSFIPYLQSPSPTTVLIFIGEGMPTDFIKEAKDGAFHFKRPSQGETPQWIRSIAQELGFTRREALALRAQWKDKLSEFEKLPEER